MGDCRIRFQVSKSLLRHLAASREKDEQQQEDKERPHSIRSVAGGESSTADVVTSSAKNDRGAGRCSAGDVLLSLNESSADPTSTRSDAPVLVEAKNYASDTTVRELVEMLSIPTSSRSLEAIGAAAPSAGGDVPLLPSVVGGVAPVPVLELLESQKAKLWDCTRYPPVDITSWPLELYTDRQGRKSRTLFDAGWFPGGTLLLLPYEQLSPSAGNDDRYGDRQYNSTTQSGNTSASSQQRVELRGGPSSAMSCRPMPSQVMASVSDRFAADAIDKDEARKVEEMARMERRNNQRRKRAAMEERLTKLDARIRKLDENSTAKNKKVSEQVQRMLIKSRATGRTDLKMQDRFYLRFVVDDGTSSASEQFRYVSRQDTVGRILSSFVSPTTQSASSELLVLRPSSSSFSHAARYRRLPVLRRVHELVSDGHLAEFDRVVVRFYDPATEDGPTPSVDDVEGDDDDVNDDPDHKDDSAEPFSMTSMERLASSSNCSHKEGGAPSVAEEVTQSASLPPLDDDRLHRRLRDAIAAYNSGDGSSVRRKGVPGGTASGKSTTSATSVKVRHMQMKGRATGDKNRVKMEDRFYVDLMIVVDEAGDSDGGPSLRVLNASPVFLSKSDPLQRLVRDFVVRTSKAAAALPEQVDLFVATGAADSGTASFRHIDDTTTTFLDAERDGVLHNFDRVVAYVHH